MTDEQLRGNSFEQLARKALRDGRAEAPWLLLRNMHFREGTPREGYAAMEAEVAELGVAAKSEWRNMPNATRMQWVVFTPRPPEARE